MCKFGAFEKKKSGILCVLTGTLDRIITSYALAKYPENSSCVSAILNMWRTCGGFAVGYFQPAWIARNGLGLVFGIQAVVVCVAIILSITPVILWGHRESQADHDHAGNTEAVEAV